MADPEEFCWAPQQNEDLVTQVDWCLSTNAENMYVKEIWHFGDPAEASPWNSVAPNEGPSPSGFVLFPLCTLLDLDYSTALTGQELSLHVTWVL